jgi:hypothetical protein
MWIHVTIAWRVLGLWMEDTASRNGGLTISRRKIPAYYELLHRNSELD